MKNRNIPTSTECACKSPEIATEWLFHQACETCMVAVGFDASIFDSVKMEVCRSCKFGNHGKLETIPKQHKTCEHVKKVSVTWQIGVLLRINYLDRSWLTTDRYHQHYAPDVSWYGRSRKDTWKSTSWRFTSCFYHFRCHTVTLTHGSWLFPKGVAICPGVFVWSYQFLPVMHSPILLGHAPWKWFSSAWKKHSYTSSQGWSSDRIERT